MHKREIFPCTLLCFQTVIRPILGVIWFCSRRLSIKMMLGVWPTYPHILRRSPPVQAHREPPHVLRSVEVPHVVTTSELGQLTLQMLPARLVVGDVQAALEPSIITTLADSGRTSKP